MRGGRSIVFSSDFTALALGAATALPGGLAIARSASSATVQTSASAVAINIAANTARIGDDGNGQGLVVDQATTNECPNSSPSAWSANSVTITTSTGPGGEPCGRVADSNAGALGFALQSYTQTTSVSYAISYWYADVSGAAGTKIGVNENGVSDTDRFTRPVTAGWNKGVKLGTSSVTAATNVLVLPAADAAANTGTADFALVQIERGSFATEAIVTSGGSASGNNDRLYHSSASALVRRGRLGLEIKLRPKGSSSAYTTNMRLWTVDANNYAEIDKSTRQITGKINNVAFTLATAIPTWAAGDVLEVWIEAGGAVKATNGAARVNGGATTQCGTASAQGTGLPIASGIDLLCNGTSAQFSARVQRLRAYAPGAKPSWA